MGGMVYHVLNRSNARRQILDSPADYELFEQVLEQAHQRVAMRTVAYCPMPNHWHLVLWPRADGDLSEFMRWLTVTHTQRWHAAAGTAGTGHVYQGRFKSFPVQSDVHCLRVCRYVERNALRAGLVPRAEDWRWGSLWRRQSGGAEALLRPGPVGLPEDWLELVNQPLSQEELDALRLCANRGRPYGGPIWTKRTAARLGLASTLRRRGRPRKEARVAQKATRGS
ncbi:MAG TPA: transposase [Phycisphaerae bacterium]|nr:transposase [Phycisphaerae bacterium]